MYKRTNTRQLIDFANVQEHYCVLVAVPYSVWGIMQKLYEERGQWITTYYTTIINDTYYNSPTKSEFIAWLDDANNAYNEGGIMACADELILALNSIAQKMGQCCSSSGSYVEGPNGELWYGTEQPTSEINSDSADKCRIANALVEGWIVNLRYASTFTVASLLAGAILTVVVFSLMGTPPIGVFLALAGLGFAFGGFTAIADYIETNKSDIVCAVYSSSTYTQLMLYLEELTIDIVSSLSIEIYGIEIALLQLFKAYWDTATYNRLQLGIDGIEAVNPVDCDLCDNTCNAYEVIIGDGTVSDLGGDTYEFSGNSVQSGVWHYVTLQFGTQDGSECGTPATVLNTSTSGVTASSPPSYRMWSYLPTAGQSGDIYNSNTSPGTTDYANVVAFTVKSATAFTATIRFSVSVPE